MTKKQRQRMREYFEAVLKDDQDYDYYFFLTLMRYKIQRMHDHMKSHAILVNTARYCAQMRETIDCLTRLIENKYHDEIFKDIYKKYGPLKMIKVKEDKAHGLTQVQIKYAKETPRNSAYIHKKTKELYALEHKTRRADLKRAMMLIYKHLESWWD